MARHIFGKSALAGEASSLWDASGDGLGLKIDRAGLDAGLRASDAGPGGLGFTADAAAAPAAAIDHEPDPLPRVLVASEPTPYGGNLAAPLPVYSIGLIGTYVKQSFWDWFGGGSYYRSFDMSSAAGTGNNGVLYYNYSGFSGIAGAGTDTDGLSTARRDLVDDALDYIGEVLGISFVLTTSTSSAVDLFFKDNDSGAYSDSVLHGTGNGSANHRFTDYSWVNIEPGWSGGTSNFNDYTYQTFIHEIGHAIGLGHSGRYNGTANYVTDSTNPNYLNNSNVYLNDSWQQSIMSYIDQDENTYIPSATSYAYVISYMAGDWEALRSYYGSAQAFNGNTTYGFNTNISSTTNQAFATLSTLAAQTAFCIIDSDGVDTVDFSGYGSNQRIDITIASASSTTGTISNIGGLTGNMTLGVGTVIENAVGGSGSDYMVGNTAANVLTGNGGNDTIYGGSGNDSIVGGAGNDTLYGQAGNDTLDGGTGVDYMNGGDGDDRYNVDSTTDTANDIGTGVDTVFSTVTFTLSSSIENLTLTGSVAIDGTGNTLDNAILGNSGNNLLTGLGGNDNISGGGGVDTVLGGDGNDTLQGGSGTDSVDGGAGNDLILFTSGHYYDSVNGGSGTDTLDASAVTRNGDTFDFNAGTISGYPGGQTVASIEIFLGGQGDETIVSDGNSNSYYGNGGNDTMVAGLGDETMDGGAGTDTIDLTLWSGPYTIDMATGVPVQWPSELFTNFENLISGGGNDSITGTSGANTITTNAGNDTILGGKGDDTLFGGAGDDLLLGGWNEDDVSGEGGNDTIRVVDDDFYDNSYGGNGTDTLDHSTSIYEGSTFDFEAGLTTSSYTTGGTAVLSAIEIYLDGVGGNTIVSDGNGNSYYGNGGDDLMIAEVGSETMDGGAGIDTIDVSRGGVDYTLDLATGIPVQYPSELFTNFENLISGSGNDSITGTSGSNVITTDAGDDSINAGDGTDTVDAGAGNDTITDTQAFYPGAIDVYDGGAGVDTLVHNLNWVSTVTFDLSGGWAIYNGDNYDQLLNIENLTIGGSASMVGSTADNMLIALGTDANDIESGDGNDTVDAGGGNDSVYGGKGDDSIVGGAGNDVIYGGKGMDSILAGDGNDSILDDDEYDGIDATTVDVIDGGNGVDTYSSVNPFGPWGNDITFDLTTGFVVTALGNFDQLISIENLTVGGSATMIGDALNNVLTASGTGSNLIRGEGGNDLIVDGEGDDVIDGGTGTDTLSYSTALAAVVVNLSDTDPQVTVGAGIDTVTGIENLTGSAYNDVLAGDEFANVIDGSVGADAMIGGDGSDTYIVDNIGDAVIETNKVSATGGTDIVWSYLANYVLSGSVENGRIVRTDAANLTGNSLGNVLFAGTGDNVINGLGGNDTVSYSSGVPGLIGVTVDLGIAAPQATGGSGTDTLLGIENINGSGRNDVLIGDAGNNALNGNFGNDVLTGKAGLDRLTGSSGSDTFVFSDLSDSGSTQATADVITDFLSSQVDKIDLTGLDADLGLVGDQAFAFVGTGAFTGVAQARFDSTARVLYLNVDGDFDAEMAISLIGVTSLASADILG